MASPLKLEQDVQGKVDSFRARIAQEAEDLVSTFFPQKLSELDSWVQELRLQDLSIIRSVPAPETPVSPDTAGDGPNRDRLPLQTQSSIKVLALPGGEGQLLRSNQHLVELIQHVKPELELLREKCNTVRMWVQLLLPKAEDGNNFGVSIQEDTADQLWTVEREHSSLLSTPLLHLLQHPGQVGIQDSEIPPGGRLSPHCSRGQRKGVPECAPDPAPCTEPVCHLA
ncbi:hypothetical protein E2I00_010050 [Balaenoptera physalus]|uniref:Proteasome activator complex subunit 3 n=1 Tax=Balaenoptera physalus TaxID=9770 RepID=A0A643BSH0_BALPH|nr:hypothetical protein E2I00_010050 [Balaenoptera physalus]